MSDLTHLRIIFPKGTNLRNRIRIDHDPEHGLVARVLYSNVYWDGMEPAFTPEMEVHVGIEREPETDIFGTVKPVLAKGLIRGFYIAWERDIEVRINGSLGWLVMALRYDMQEGPEVWNADWHLVHAGTGEVFCYALEREE